MAAPAKTPAKPVVLDSSCWLEVFDGGPRAPLYQAQAAAVAQLVVPIVTVYEVYKYLRRVRDEDAALRASLYMQQGQVVVMDATLATAAAANGLPLADSLIYATAQMRGAVLWTQDAHFDGLPGVKYFPKDA